MPVIPLLSLLMPTIGSVLDKLLPDPVARAKAENELIIAITEAQAKVDAAQIEVNKVEAASSNLFVAGWRPFIGWVCGIAVMWQFVGYHMITYGMALVGLEPPGIPTLDSSALFTMLTAMLGMGGLRTFEKVKGVAAK